jgi:hypothetical protein
MHPVFADPRTDFVFKRIFGSEAGSRETLFPGAPVTVMKHRSSAEDQVFRTDFEACKFPPAQFNHRAHVRLAYVYLTDHDTIAAHRLMRRALLTFLQHHGVDVSKYHETMTQAWIMAVRHFMEISPGSESSETFMENNPTLLDSKVMMTHYSAEVLFSDEARAKFVEPNLSPIPRYGS